MNVMILIILIIAVLYFALTYLKTSGNSNTNSDGLTTRPFGGGAAGNNGIPPELENAEEVDEADDADTGCDIEADEANKVDKVDKFENAATNVVSLAESDTKAESNAAQAADPASVLGEIPVTNTSTNPGVVIDSEVHIDAKMPSDTGATGKHN